MSAPGGRPTLLLVGGGGGLVGRAVLHEFAQDHRIVSVHPHRAPNEEGAGVQWVRRDAVGISDWATLLKGVDKVLILAWYRSGGRRRFVPLGEALVRLVKAAAEANVPRLAHISVPEAPASLESSLPYLYAKRSVDRAIEESPLRYAIVRPTMLFGPRDRLLSVMLGLMHRYERFPMFGDGNYHVSPLDARDLARILRHELDLGARRIVPAGGPRRWRYRDLTDLMFAYLGLPARYFQFSPKGSVRLARLMETIGSKKICAYEVEWLLSDMLGLSPYEGLETPLAPVEPFLKAEVSRLQGL